MCFSVVAFAGILNTKTGSMETLINSVSSKTVNYASYTADRSSSVVAAADDDDDTGTAVDATVPPPHQRPMLPPPPNLQDSSPQQQANDVSIARPLLFLKCYFFLPTTSSNPIIARYNIYILYV